MILHPAPSPSTSLLLRALLLPECIYVLCFVSIVYSIFWSFHVFIYIYIYMCSSTIKKPRETSTLLCNTCITHWACRVYLNVRVSISPTVFYWMGSCILHVFTYMYYLLELCCTTKQSVCNRFASFMYNIFNSYICKMEMRMLILLFIHTCISFSNRDHHIDTYDSLI